MQSERNSFCGDVVLDSVNIEFRDKDNLCFLQNIWISIIFEFLSWRFQFFWVIEENSYSKTAFYNKEQVVWSKYHTEIFFEHVLLNLRKLKTCLMVIWYNKTTFFVSILLSNHYSKIYFSAHVHSIKLISLSMCGIHWQLPSLMGGEW